MENTMHNGENDGEEGNLGPLRGSRRWLGITPPENLENIPDENSPEFAENVRSALQEQTKGLPRAIWVLTLSQSQIAEQTGLADAPSNLRAMAPRTLLRVRHTMEQMQFAPGDEVDCVYARVKGDHHLLRIMSWSQGSGAFEDEAWKTTMRRLPGPQDHLGRAADRTARRHGADVAHWQEKNGARLWSEMQRELAEFEAGLGIPRGSFGRMIAWCDRLSRADFLDQQNWMIEMVQNKGCP